MDLTMMQKKKHLLLLNRIMRAELKKDIIPTPSKLTEEEVNQYFNKLFVKKDDYYVPIKTKAEIMIDEELFKDLVKKPKAIKTKEEKKQEKDTQKEKEKEMKVNIINGLYNKFNNDFVKPYESKKRSGANFKEEEQKMINRYIKYGDDVKKLIKIKLPPLWEAVLNKAFLEREKRKKGLVEGEMKLKDEIKQEAKKKTEDKIELKETKQKNNEDIKNEEYQALKKDFNNKLDELIEKNNVYLNNKDKIKKMKEDNIDLKNNINYKLLKIQYEYALKNDKIFKKEKKLINSNYYEYYTKNKFEFLDNKFNNLIATENLTYNDLYKLGLYQSYEKIPLKYNDYLIVEEEKEKRINSVKGWQITNTHANSEFIKKQEEQRGPSKYSFTGRILKYNPELDKEIEIMKELVKKNK